MGLKKTLASFSHFSTSETSRNQMIPQFVKKVKKGLFPLSANVYQNGEWNRQQLPENLWLYTIGKAVNCNIVLKDDSIGDVQIIVRLFGDRWFVLETSPNHLATFNGQSKRQAYVTVGSSLIISVGNSQVLLSTNENSREFSSTIINNEIIADYLLSYNNKGFAFEIDKNVLIGSNKMCDVEVEGPEFAAVVSPVGKKMYITALGNTDIKVTGRTVDNHAYALNDGAKIFVEGLRIDFQYPCDSGGAQSSFKMVGANGPVRYCFQEVDDDANLGKKYILPPIGRSIFVGRGSENYFVINSTQVSRKHAQMIIYENGVLLLDCYSTNGTFINEEKITKKMAKPGDVVGIGTKSFLLCYSE